MGECGGGDVGFEGGCGFLEGVVLVVADVLFGL